MEVVMTTAEVAQDVSQAKDSFDIYFDVPVPPDRAWPVLSNIPRIVPYIPQVTLTEVLDDRTYQGLISIGLGPLNCIFSMVVTVEDLNPATYTARLRARGSDKRDRSGADGTISFQLLANADGSKVLMRIELALLGPVARYGSLEMVKAAATQIITQFAEKLRAELSRSKDQTPTTATQPAQT
jgi:carbon monoxide dehydrogenase subunit G